MRSQLGIGRRVHHRGDSGLLYADEVLCRRWTMLIVDALAEGPLRFSELQRELATISSRSLSSRLRELEEIDVVGRIAMNAAKPYAEYELTRHGRRLLPVVNEMRRLIPGPLPARPIRVRPQAHASVRDVQLPANSKTFAPTGQQLASDESEGHQVRISVAEELRSRDEARR